MLAQAVDWLASRRSDLNLDEQRYIEASVALRQRAEEEKEAAREIELRRQLELAEAADNLAKSFRVTRKFALVAGCTAMIAVIFAIGLVGASNEAEEHSQAATAAASESADKPPELRPTWPG